VVATAVGVDVDDRWRSWRLRGIMVVVRRASLWLTAIGLATGGCGGECDGALRGAPRSSGKDPCTEGPGCAVVISAEPRFSQNADHAYVDDPERLLEEANLTTETWFLLDEMDGHVESELEARANDTAHSCASLVTFTLEPLEPLEPGVYRMVLLTGALAWSQARKDVQETTFEGTRAIVQYYRVEAG
jgi:hypothetical protein